MRPIRGAHYSLVKSTYQESMHLSRRYSTILLEVFVLRKRSQFDRRAQFQRSPWPPGGSHQTGHRMSKSNRDWLFQPTFSRRCHLRSLFWIDLKNKNSQILKFCVLYFCKNRLSIHCDLKIYPYTIWNLLIHNNQPHIFICLFPTKIIT